MIFENFIHKLDLEFCTTKQQRESIFNYFLNLPFELGRNGITFCQWTIGILKIKMHYFFIKIHRVPINQVGIDFAINRPKINILTGGIFDKFALLPIGTIMKFDPIIQKLNSNPLGQPIVLHSIMKSHKFNHPLFHQVIITATGTTLAPFATPKFSFFELFFRHNPIINFHLNKL